MSDQPTPEDTALWQRRLASQANNRAWDLAEQPARSAAEDEEMLNAAHAALYFWRLAGNAGHHAHAAQLLAHVFALLGLGKPARHYQSLSQPLLLGAEAKPWERAMAHAVAANVAAANHDDEAHREHYATAARLIEALPDAKNRAILEATFRVLPVPGAAPGTP